MIDYRYIYRYIYRHIYRYIYRYIYDNIHDIYIYIICIYIIDYDRCIVDVSIDD